MYPLKKITKEDTWRSDDLKVHIQGHHEESRRRDRSKREGEHKKHRDGESLDRRHRDPDRDAKREREKQRESTKEGSKHRDPDRDRNQDSKGEEVREDRYKEKSREREKAVDNSSHRDGDKGSEEKRREMENSKRRRNREKDRYNDGDIGMYKQRDRDIEGDRKKDGERERKIEMDRRKEERREDLDHSRTEERVRDKERERRERHRARESDYSQHENKEKQREGDSKAHSGHKEREHRIDRENREKRRRDKGSHEADTSHSREVERERRHQERKEPKDYLHDIKDGDKERMKARERKEQDRRRERRYKEDSDSKRNDRKRTEKHKESSGHKHSDRINRDKEESTAIPQLTWRSIQAQMSDPEIPVENDEEDKQSGKDYHNDDYEEDFENYEEDFEDEDEEEDDKDEVEHDNRGREEKRELSPRRREEIEAIQRAIDEENERISSARSQRTTTESAFPYRENHSDGGRTHGKIIDFVSAKHREISQKVAKKQKKRSEELLRLIDLDFSITFSLLDLPPVNEYDMYIKNFGTTNTKQAYVQCNEDNVDRDIQTEEVEMMDKWTQHPPETKAACGGPKVSQETTDESMARMTTDSQRLTAFLRSAKQVMAVLIEENMAESNSLRRLRSQTDALSFSDGCLQLNTKLPFLHGRQVSLLQFSHIQRQTLLSVHPPSSKTSAVPLNSETVICVWNIWEPSRPQKILLYESEVMCCCFSPGKVTLVFAGTSVGSVVVWDLREHSGTHCNLVVGKEDWTLRYPTFSTDAVLSGVGHLSPVVSIEPVLSTGETGSNSILTADIEESLGLSFQLGSLDENGVLTLWVVVELPKGNDSGSQTDLGLRPGGKVKLLHSSSLQTTEKSLQHIIGCGPPLSLQLKFLPSDSNHYFVGTNMGLVRHGTRHSLKVLPKFYRSQFDSCKPVEVTTLDFSPSGEPFFLVGCSDGTVRLHSVLRETPLMEWSGCSICTPILSVQWSQTRPAVFCVLDAASDLHIWDLTEKDYMPVITENIHNDRVTAMAVFGEPAKQNTFSGVALAKQSGKVEIQYFKKSLTVSKASDKEKLQSVLQDTF
ncbi:cytoplasmic dynein 2 intermediate chain 1-like isoform X2 [Myxocyprinus asiaticus]|uniref:cytoplasmic dynein 2 intermediate chain 1-like isoform X2 n=1 Tax=Myxocyprinus asiaticus TaxID=70543 RepID=UPI0022215DAA|nr:cytoplasmic dynein 2 intermediate chain 1-like isoform X2 [Myxocyprinus asiaticus]